MKQKKANLQSLTDRTIADPRGSARGPQLQFFVQFHAVGEKMAKIIFLSPSPPFGVDTLLGIPGSATVNRIKFCAMCEEQVSHPRGGGEALSSSHFLRFVITAAPTVQSHNPIRFQKVENVVFICSACLYN